MMDTGKNVRVVFSEILDSSEQNYVKENPSLGKPKGQWSSNMWMKNLSLGQPKGHCADSKHQKK